MKQMGSVRIELSFEFEIVAQEEVFKKLDCIDWQKCGSKAAGTVEELRLPAHQRYQDRRKRSSLAKVMVCNWRHFFSTATLILDGQVRFQR